MFILNKRHMAHTSLEAYTKIFESGALTDGQEAVYRGLIDIGRGTNEEIADHLRMKLQSVTGRVTELIKLGLATADGMGLSKSGNSSRIVCATNPNDVNLRKIR